MRPSSVVRGVVEGVEWPGPRLSATPPGEPVTSGRGRDAAASSSGGPPQKHGSLPWTLPPKGQGALYFAFLLAAVSAQLLRLA